MYSLDRKIKLWALITLLTLGMLFLISCAGEPVDETDVLSYEVQLYFAKSEYVESGDESLGIYIVDSRKIEIDKDTNPWIAVVESLKKPGSDQLWTALDQDVDFNDIYIDEESPETLIVDLESVSGGGSLKEGIFIGQIVKTCIVNSKIIDSESEVEQVQFLLNGQFVESLMGHYEAYGPFGMEDI